jgi:hypothetical protein
MQATAKTRVIELTYTTIDGAPLKNHLAGYPNLAKPPAGYTVETKPVRFSFEEGQLVTIKSDQPIRVIFEPPDRYQPSVLYTKDNQSVKVLRAAREGEKGMLRCGPVNEHNDLIGPESGHGVDG